MSLAVFRRPAVACLRNAGARSTVLRIPSTSRRTFTSLLTTPRPSLQLPRRLLPPPTATSIVGITPTPFPSIGNSVGPTLQVRGHKRKTYNPSHRVRKRRFGFLARLRSKTGRRILKRRLLKGRKMLTH
ncbi:hypothetical protein TWF696_009039 [Orbilia brochopaga]|uniref:Large ribosomal subunit protein bL34m n=1 Tax=Orbilia brochopaga TaxID=3140254 RepID=A0AAV9UE32_9PEZI